MNASAGTTELERKALARLDEQKEQLFATLSKLVQFDSQNFCGSGREKDCAEYIAGLYRDLGLETELYCPDSVPGVTGSPLYWPGHNTDKRPQVTGLRPGTDPDSRVMIEAHIDTMPAGDLSAWELSPFSGAVRDGRIYGLGSGDNKFGIAGSYWALKILDELGVRLRKTVALTAYCDEEFGGGNGALAACLKYPCETYVNLDGGNYEMWAMALGGGCFQIDLHRSEPTDDCMHIYDAADAVMRELKLFGERRRKELEANPGYHGTLTAESAFRLSGFGSIGESHTDARISFVLYTDRIRAEIEGELAEVLRTLAPALKAAGVTTEGFVPTTRFFGYYETDRSSPAFVTMKRCAEDAAGHPVRVCGACLSDLSVIFPAGKTSSCFNFGILRDFSLPGGAHQPNEYVDCGQFVQHTKALILFLLRFCA